MLADVGHIVVVDDDPSLRHMVIKYLEDHNVPTKAASNKAELNRHLQASLPSLIILDLRLGQDDGLDLLREIRAYSDIPVIITTGIVSVHAINSFAKSAQRFSSFATVSAESGLMTACRLIHRDRLAGYIR